MSDNPSTGVHAHPLSRRRLLKTGLAAMGAAGVLSTGVLDRDYAAAATVRQVSAGRPHDHGDDDNSGSNRGTSLNNAYAFLNLMMDRYASGSTLRLAQSYSDQNGLNSTAFTYDNALQIIAYLSRRTRDDLARARILGDSLLYAQSHDPQYSDGRLRDSYFIADPATNAYVFIQSNGTVSLDGPPAFLNGTAVGNVAWAGLALARLAAYTGARSYLDGALKLGAWIVNNEYDPAGGYKFGANADNTPSPNGKSTEHNIDTYAFFVELAQLTHDQPYAGLTSPQPWSALAQHALDFVHAMWEPTAAHFWTGTNPDGSTNTAPIPEDVQTWSYLALRDPAYAASLDWAKTHVAVTDTPESFNAAFTGNLAFSGITFSNASLKANPFAQPNSYTPKPDPSGVWFEGTAHIADALLLRHARDNGDTALGDDVATALYYLNNTALAQQTLGQGQTVGGQAIPGGLGVVAASSPLDTGFGFDYFPYLHIGATSWYLMAAQRVNPYRLGGA